MIGTPLGWLHRTRRPRTSRVLPWGHRGMDRPFTLPEQIDPSHPLARTDTFLTWLRSYGLDNRDVFLVELGTVGFRVHRYARDERGCVRLEMGEQGMEPARRPALNIQYSRVVELERV